MKNLGNSPRYSLDFSLRDTHQAVARVIRPEPPDSGVTLKKSLSKPCRSGFSREMLLETAVAPEGAPTGRKEVTSWRP